MENNFINIIASINETLAAHSMWDGFWIHSFKKETLVISASFDKIYYRNFDMIFKKVNFFNVPAEWRDTNLIGDDLIRLAAPEEFKAQQPDVDPQDKIIFAIDLKFDNNGHTNKHSFFIVAKHIYLQACSPSDNNPIALYIDPCKGEKFPVVKNRVLKT